MSDQENSPGILHPLTSLEWDELPPLPVKTREAQIVCLNGTVYVGGGSIVSDSDAKLFSLRPGVDSAWTATDTPTSQFALVVHDSKLLLIGGFEWPSRLVTNRIYTMDNKSFVETLPPMKEKGSFRSAVSTGCTLVVAGGYGASRYLPSVEVFRWSALARYLSTVEVFKDGEWTTAPSLPGQCAEMNSAFNGKHWALKTSQRVFQVSLESLISGAVQSPWETLPKPPNHGSTIAYFGGCLVSVGGYRANSVSVFSQQSHSWVEVDSDLPAGTEVYSSCAIGLPSGELIVIGRNKGESYGERVLRASIDVPLVNSDVRFSVSTLFRMDSYGINLIEALSKNKDYFQAASGVQLLTDDRMRGSSLRAMEYVKMIFEYWERSNDPTYPATWEGLFTVLRKMNLGHLVVKIAKCVTGSVPEESPLTSELTTQKEAHLEVEREESYKLLKEKTKQLTKEIQQLKDENRQLREENNCLESKLSSQTMEVPICAGKQSSEVSWPEQLEASIMHECTRFAVRLPVCVDQPSSEPAQPTTETQMTGEPQIIQRTALESKSSHITLPQNKSFDLPGVEFVGWTSLTVTNSVQSFYWTGYGFKLHIPQDSLPVGVDQCRLDIIASVVGQYQLPDNQQLVSAVCWVRPDPVCRFRNKLTIEMQHCAKSTKLCFVRANCSQGVPYTFKKLDGCGYFTEQSSYGTLEVDHFSGFAITGDQDLEKLYIASLYYRNKNPWTIDIHFVITLAEPAHIHEAKSYYEEIGAEERTYLEVEFERDQISLDIPMPEGVSVNEWTMTPLVRPQISRKRVDSSFKPGRRAISRQLMAKLPEDCMTRVPTRYHLVTLQGAKEPNEMTIALDAFYPSHENDQVSTSIVPKLSATTPLQYTTGPSRLSLEQSHTSLTLSPATHPPPPHWAMQLQHRSLVGYSHSTRVAGDLYGGMNAGAVLGSTRAIEYPAVTLDQLVDHVGIDKDLLDKECSERHLTRIVKFIPNWLKYAKALKLTHHQIQDIEDERKMDNAMKALRVFEMWHERYSFTATYQRLVDVCLSMEHVSVATDICKALKEDNPSEYSSRSALTGEKRRQEEVTEHTEKSKCGLPERET